MLKIKIRTAINKWYGFFFLYKSIILHSEFINQLLNFNINAYE